MIENTHYKIKEPSCRTGTDAYSICSENANFSTKYDTLSDLTKITVKAIQFAGDEVIQVWRGLHSNPKVPWFVTGDADSFNKILDE